MATINVRHQLHLHRAQVGRFLLLAVVVLLLPVSGAWAQRKAASRANRSKGGILKSITVNNLSEYDSRWFHPGMYLALTASRFNLEQSTAYITRQNITANAVYSPTLGVGFIGDVRLGRAALAVHFSVCTGC